MPVLEQRITVIVRSVRAFLNLQAGVTRGGTVPWPALADQDRQLEEPPRELAELQSQPTGNGAEDPRQRQAGPLVTRQTGSWHRSPFARSS